MATYYCKVAIYFFRILFYLRQIVVRFTLSIFPILSIVNPAINIDNVSYSAAVSFILDISPSKAV